MGNNGPRPIPTGNREAFASVLCLAGVLVGIWLKGSLSLDMFVAAVAGWSGACLVYYLWRRLRHRTNPAISSKSSADGHSSKNERQHDCGP